MAAAILCCIATVAVAERPWLGNALAATVAAAAAFTCVVIAALGRIWTSVFIAGFKDATLVRSGPYSACRHPLYALSLVGMLGLGLAMRSLALTGVLFAVAVLTHARAIRAEEALLAAHHGDEAQDYRDKVPALLPRLSLYSVPETLEVRPRVLWKAFLDAGSPLPAYGLIQAAHAAQVAGVTPALLRLP
jgi:protein-S-isoprenylcysteine O-methyltransferase Ste14